MEVVHTLKKKAGKKKKKISASPKKKEKAHIFFPYLFFLAYACLDAQNGTFFKYKYQISINLEIKAVLLTIQEHQVHGKKKKKKY